jgi:CHAT domain-containing protein
MKFLSLLPLPGLILIPVTTLNQKPVSAIVQQANSVQEQQVEKLYKEGEGLLTAGQYSAALKKFQQALGFAQRIKYKQAEGAILLGIGKVYSSRIQHPEALKYYQQSLSIVKAIRDKKIEGVLLYNIGFSYNAIGQYPAALNYYQQALSVSKMTKVELLQGVILNDIGEVYRSIGEYAKALDSYQQSLSIHKTIGNKTSEGVTLANIGTTYQSIGKYTTALEYLKQALTANRAANDQIGVGISLNMIGLVYDSLGQYPNALTYYEQARQINIAIGDKVGEGTSLTNIGAVYQSLGQYSKALGYYQQTLSINKAIGNKLLAGGTLNNIGNAYRSLQHYDKALESFNQALLLSQEIGYKAGEGNTLDNIGQIYTSLGKNSEAIGYYQQALAISEQIGNKASVGNSLNNLGASYQLLGQYPKALEYYKKALTINKAISNKNYEGTTLTNIGANFLGQKKPALAEKPLREAIAIWETIRGSKNNSGQGLSDSDKVAFADRIAITYKLLQKALIQQNKPQVALEVAERGRARALAELLAARAINVATNTPIIAKAPNLAKIQQIAKSQNATLVEYSLIDESIYIWVISPSGQITFQQSKLPPNTTIKDLVNTSRDDIGVRGRSGSRNTPSSTTAAQGNLKLLHKLLIAPISKSLPKDPNQRIIFIPQGELFFVPFVALQDNNDKYLIEQHTISTASAIGLLDSTPKPAKFNPRQGTSIVVGNPIMPPAPDGTQLVPLEGAEKEAIAIGNILKTTPLIGAQADKNVVINKMRSASIIHLATHGLLDKVKGDIPGAIALTNGLLTSNEIFDLKLQANLVVLSACDTGGGDLSGDGVIGLSRALAAAGTPSVAVSLWSVDDNATQELMVEFYQNWYSKGMNKDQAMRQAMLKVMKSHEKPRDWAAFTILGEAR